MPGLRLTQASTRGSYRVRCQHRWVSKGRIQLVSVVYGSVPVAVTLGYGLSYVMKGGRMPGFRLTGPAIEDATQYDASTGCLQIRCLA